MKNNQAQLSKSFPHEGCNDEQFNQELLIEGSQLIDNEDKDIFLTESAPFAFFHAHADSGVDFIEKNIAENLIQTANVIVVALNETGEIIFLNNASTKITGYTPGELYGKSWFDVIVPRERYPKAWGEFSALIESGNIPETFENHILTKSGNEKFISWQNSLLHKSGKIAGTISLGIDRTEQKMAELAVLESAEKYRSVFRNAPIGIYRTSPDGQILLANPSLVRMLGYDNFEELKKRDLEREYYEPEYQRSDFRLQIERDGEIKGIETEWKRKDGSKIYVRESAKVFRCSDDQVLYYEGMVEDITERRQAEIALQASEMRLSELNATKDKLFSIIAHDLRNPFNAIVGFSSILSEQLQEKDFENAAKYADFIMESATSAMDLLRNLLAWSRLQVGRMTLKPEQIKLVPLINETIYLLKDLIHQKSLAICVGVPPDLTIVADKAMLGTILRNLISNAIKFTHSEGKIEISTEFKPDELLVAVKDNGVGIGKEDQLKLFMLGGTISTSGTKNEGGSGLGLLLCSEFIEIHGGKIWVESEAGNGSTFFFTIPKSLKSTSL